MWIILVGGRQGKKFPQIPLGTNAAKGRFSKDSGEVTTPCAWSQRKAHFLTLH